MGRKRLREWEKIIEMDQGRKENMAGEWSVPGGEGVGDSEVEIPVIFPEYVDLEFSCPI